MAKLHGKAKAAFLRKMARGRAKAHGYIRVRTKKHKKHKSRGKGEHVAKRRRRRSGRFSRVKRHARRFGGGVVGRLVPALPDIISAVTAYGYGSIESSARKDQNHFLNNVPRVITGLGQAGNAGLILWGAGVVTRSPIVRAVARGVLDVSAYQLGARGKMFESDSEKFTLSGYSDDDIAAAVEDYMAQASGGGGQF